MSQLSRRQFLEDSLFAATAALSVGGAATALAQQDQPQSTSPGERISVAVIGVRGQGNGHLGAYVRDKRTEVTYICDADEAVGMTRVEEVAKRQGRAPKYVQDLRKVFDDPNVDLVSTATPNHWHALVSIWAMQHGKDVYVEKPVSHNVSEGRRMVETARKHARICQTGTQCRSTKATREAIEFVKSGEIGEVKLARGLCYKRRPSIGPKGNYDPPASVNYDLWTGPAALVPLTRKNLHYDWHWVWNTGNGDLGNQGIHQMDIARWGLGVDTLPSRVMSYGGRVGYEDAGETANTQVITHDYGDKRLVFEVRGLPTDGLRGASIGVIFYGTKGYVVMTEYTKGAAFDLEGKMIRPFTGGGDHFGNFISATQSRKSEDLHADILQGHLSSALCHLGNIAYRLGTKMSAAEAKERVAKDEEMAETIDRFSQHLSKNSLPPEKTEILFGDWLAFNPAAEKFVHNDKADAMLTRDYRAPFIVPAAGQV